jgi:signal transduction histidine kinase
MISSASKRRYRSSLAAFLILGSGFALSGIAAAWLHAAERARAELHFQREADKYIAALERGMHDAQAALTTLGRFMATSESLSAEQFMSIAQPMQDQGPGIEAIAYLTSPGVSGAPIDDNLPLSLDVAATGALDPATLQVVQQTAQRAISLDLPVASQAFQLASGTEETPATTALVMAVPLHRKKGPRAATAAVLRIDELAVQAWKNAGIGGIGTSGTSDNMISFVYELDAGRRSKLVFTNGIGNTAFTGKEEPVDMHVTAYAMSRRIDVVNGQWQMDVIMERGLPGMQYLSALLVLLSGMLLTALAAWYVFRLGYRTKSLAWANRALKSNVRAHELSEQALLESQRELRNLANYQERVKEEERKRIAREIHDDLGQSLLVLRIDVSLLLQELKDNDSKLHGRLLSVLQQTDATIRSVRSIINNLRPVVLDLGLLAAIDWQVKQMNNLHGVQFELRTELQHEPQADRSGDPGKTGKATIDNFSRDPGDDFGRELSDEQATSVFRVVQEAMSNVVRHADATHALVRLAFEGTMLKIVIKDDGASPYVEDQCKARSFGLVGMKERISALGGHFDIVGTPGEGTTLTLMIPRQAQACSPPDADMDAGRYANAGTGGVRGAAAEPADVESA